MRISVRVAAGLPFVNDVAAIVGVMTDPRLPAAHYRNNRNIRYPALERRYSSASARAVIDRWLDVQDDEHEWLDTDAESLLYGLADLVDAGASEDELKSAVRCVRLAGWDWGPIAVLLGCDREAARSRFGGGDPSTETARGWFRFLRRWQPPRPRRSSE
jgi:hypothetical protein